MFVDEQHKSKEFTIANHHILKIDGKAPNHTAASSKSGVVSRVAFDLDASAKSH